MTTGGLNQSRHRMSGSKSNLKFEHRAMPLIGALCSSGTGLHIQDPRERMKKMTVFLSLGLLILIAAVLLPARSDADSKELSQTEFMAMVQSNLLAKVRVYYPPKLGQVEGVAVMLNEVRGTFYQTDAAGQISKTQGVPRESPFIAKVHLTEELEEKLTKRTNFSFVSPNPVVQKVRELFVPSK